MKHESLLQFFKRTARDDRGIYYESGEPAVTHWMSYAQMAEAAEQIANKLKHHKPRSRMMAAIWMEQTPACFIAFMATVFAGGIPIPIHAYYKKHEVEPILSRLKPDFLLTSASRSAEFLGEKGEGLSSGLADGPLLVDGETGDSLGTEQAHVQSSLDAENGFQAPPDTAVIFLSSGSTGVPKGIMLSHRNLISNVDAIQGYLKLTPEDRVLIAKSFGYSSTITGEWLLALEAGATINLTQGIFHPLQLVRLIRDYKTTFLCTVPSVLVPLLKTNRWDPEALRSLRQLIVVGGPVSPEHLVSLQKLLPWTSIMPCYGQTEASPRVTYLPAHRLADKPQSVGIAVDGVEISIYSNGIRAEIGVIGEVVVKGPNVMLGYWDDPAATSAVLSEHGLCTSDMGYLDEEGFLFIAGRKDNALNVGGHTFFAEAVEKQLSEHSLVQEAAVAGITDSVWGQRLVAVIVADLSCMDAEQARSELFAFCQTQLTSVQRPKAIYIAEQLPKTTTGKLDRKALQSIVKEWEYAANNSTRA
ncbi:AMP-dependent synthetase and ligase [Paenibacillus curdlanolyticus YK9]|uniref:AMP-dependent synthetase and ligase n=1 Tax=Paenibacillus curdlanolyticus YK9 TaxID=717606 RepID=E0I5B8_9BACL|nr:class I adenylate-forming enzyme family protein [Paenibacillus curdlanolyticus]EFM12160.1 AMP-dependent synthetase and ligase [Paenibacillus curdlanolyticus YK9]